MRWWQRLFGRTVTVTKVSRPLTAAEEKAFDNVFEKMDQTFNAMEEFFDVARSADGSASTPAGFHRRGKRK